MSSPSLLVRVQSCISAHRMFPRGSRVLLAVSGGVDSMALLHLMESLAPRLGVRLRVAHLHHGLRGREADGDRALVAGYCRAHRIPFTSGLTDVRALSRHTG
ncbi:MAG: tRNA(Ile)-lysidine synthetase, partial [Candidatus Aureabacteria bacterium]|nr:tRNA(Ile)-lysidine synthetase [Candidatus Auribacterota bacterium]